MKRGINDFKVTSKKGVSPIIATVLLIAIVIIIAIIVIIWMMNFLPNAVTKFGDENIELACDKVDFDANLNSAKDTLKISNNGNVPIQRVDLKLIYTGGDYETFGILKIIKQGRIISISEDTEGLNVIFTDYKKMLVIPVLMGKTDSGNPEEYVCNERYGVEVSI